VPVHEANDCHTPAGSPQGGQFCGKGPAGKSEVGRIGAQVRDEMLAEDPSLKGESCEINAGLCDQWAERVAAKLPGAVVLSDPDTDHYFVKYKGRYYDAERIEGVVHPSWLPFIRRHRDLAKRR
jgi:hypothetical protein